MNFFRFNAKPSKTTAIKSKKPTNAPQLTTQQPKEEPLVQATNEQPLFSSEDAKKLKKLRQPGIVILIDQPNLEITLQEHKKDEQLKISYGYLIDIISRGGDRSQPRRNVLNAFLVTSKVTQYKQKCRPSRRYAKLHNIKIERSPDERVFRYNKSDSKQDKPSCSCSLKDCKNGCCKIKFSVDDKEKRKPDDKLPGEKAVDCMLTRLMTQEFERLKMLRLQGINPPPRTFCLVAGNFDYVDVVQQARKVGCDVEIWFWTKARGMSQQWGTPKVRDACDSEGCGNLTIMDLEEFLEDKEDEHPGYCLKRTPKKDDDEEEKWSFAPYDSDPDEWLQR